MSIADKLLELQNTKTAIKSAIEAKGQDLTGIPFSEYAEKIMAIEGGGGGESPQLNPPIISLNASTFIISIANYRNGNFTEEFLIYVNGENIATLPATTRQFVMTDYGIGEGDEVTVRAKANLFQNSPPSDPVVYRDLSNGTKGLQYIVGSASVIWSGLGTCTETDITVASLYDGLPVTTVGAISGTRMFDGNTTPMTIRLPDSVKTINTNFLYGAGYKTVVFGVGITTIGENTFFSTIGYGNILDFRRAQSVPTYKGGWHTAAYCKAVIVPDDLYEEWKVATNWVAAAHKVLTEEEYIAKYGEITWDK